MSTQVTKVSPASLASAPHSGPGPIERILNSLPWWALPATVVTVLGLFSLYSIWTAFLTGGINQSGSYLSPFYSPTIWKTGPVSPALWVLGSPLLFRATCYYYRKAYYRSFFWDPPACAVGELRHRKYRGETAFPLFLNNLHRFLFYLVLIVTGFLWYDVYLAFWAPNGHVQLGLGTGIMLANVILLSGYTFGCHSLAPPRRRRTRLLLAVPARAGTLPRLEVGDGAQPAAPTSGRGAACSASSSPTSTSTCSEPGSSSIRTSSSEMAASPEPYDTIECDVLVVGAGGAGMRAAIAAAEAGCSVTVGHQIAARQGAHRDGRGRHRRRRSATSIPQDSWEVHFADTMLGGQLINNWRMVELYAHEVIDRVLELERWGGLFDRTEDGRIMQRAFGAHSWKRLAHVGDRTGLELIRTLPGQDGAHAGCRRVHGVHAHRACSRSGDRVCGAFGYNRNTGGFVAFKARRCCARQRGMGTDVSLHLQLVGVRRRRRRDGIRGGCRPARHGVRAVPSHRDDLATRCARHPGHRGVRGEGGLLFNAEGTRFMLDYDPVKKELSSRDVVARSIYKEVQAGRGTPHGGAYLDVRHLGADYVKRKLPSMYEQFHALASIDITSQPMEVGPTIHYTMGGVRVEPETAGDHGPRPLRGGRGGGRAARREPPWRQLAR